MSATNPNNPLPPDDTVSESGADCFSFFDDAVASVVGTSSIHPLLRDLYSAETYDILDAHGLAAHMHMKVLQLADLLNVVPTEARQLLMSYNWDEEALLATLTNGSAQAIADVCTQAGLPACAIAMSPTASADGAASSAAFSGPLPQDAAEMPLSTSCGICYEAVGTVLPATVATVRDIVSEGSSKSRTNGASGSASVLCGLYLHCRHVFCIPCWTLYVTNAVQAIGVAHNANFLCPAGGGCTARVDIEVSLALLRRGSPGGDEGCSVYNKLRDATLAMYVRASKAIQSCPSAPHCGRYINVLVPTKLLFGGDVRCVCGESWCVACEQPPHEPARCWMHEKFAVFRNSEEGLAVFWVRHNTKPCPKCLRSIEKNGGCNNMQCSICSTRYCWVCLTINPTPSHTCHQRFGRDLVSSNSESVNTVLMAELDRQYDMLKEHTSLPLPGRDSTLVPKRKIKLGRGAGRGRKSAVVADSSLGEAGITYLTILPGFSTALFPQDALDVLATSASQAIAGLPSALPGVSFSEFSHHNSSPGRTAIRPVRTPASLRSSSLSDSSTFSQSDSTFQTSSVGAETAATTSVSSSPPTSVLARPSAASTSGQGASATDQSSYFSVEASLYWDCLLRVALQRSFQVLTTSFYLGYFVFQRDWHNLPSANVGLSATTAVDPDAAGPAVLPDQQTTLISSSSTHRGIPIIYPSTSTLPVGDELELQYDLFTTHQVHLANAIQSCMLAVATFIECCDNMLLGTASVVQLRQCRDRVDRCLSSLGRYTRVVLSFVEEAEGLIPSGLKVSSSPELVTLRVIKRSSSAPDCDLRNVVQPGDVVPHKRESYVSHSCRSRTPTPCLRSIDSSTAVSLTSTTHCRPLLKSGVTVDILVHVFSFLSRSVLLSLRQTCRVFGVIITSRPVGDMMYSDETPASLVTSLNSFLIRRLAKPLAQLKSCTPSCRGEVVWIPPNGHGEAVVCHTDVQLATKSSPFAEHDSCRQVNTEMVPIYSDGGLVVFPDRRPTHISTPDDDGPLHYQWSLLKSDFLERREDAEVSDESLLALRIACALQCEYLHAVRESLSEKFADLVKRRKDSETSREERLQRLRVLVGCVYVFAIPLLVLFLFSLAAGYVFAPLELIHPPQFPYVDPNGTSSPPTPTSLYSLYGDVPLSDPYLIDKIVQPAISSDLFNFGRLVIPILVAVCFAVPLVSVLSILPFPFTQCKVTFLDWVLDYTEVLGFVLHLVSLLSFMAMSICTGIIAGISSADARASYWLFLSHFNWAMFFLRIMFQIFLLLCFLLVWFSRRASGGRNWEAQYRMFRIRATRTVVLSHAVKISVVCVVHAFAAQIGKVNGNYWWDVANFEKGSSAVLNATSTEEHMTFTPTPTPSSANTTSGVAGPPIWPAGECRKATAILYVLLGIILIMGLLTIQSVFTGARNRSGRLSVLGVVIVALLCATSPFVFTCMWYACAPYWGEQRNAWISALLALIIVMATLFIAGIHRLFGSGPFR